MHTDADPTTQIALRDALTKAYYAGWYARDRYPDRDLKDERVQAILDELDRAPDAMTREMIISGHYLATYVPTLHKAWNQWFIDLGEDPGRIPEECWVRVDDGTRSVTFPYRPPGSLTSEPRTITLDRDVPAFPAATASS